jgi:hypothetical protein
MKYRIIVVIITGTLFIKPSLLAFSFSLGVETNNAVADMQLLAFDKFVGMHIDIHQVKKGPIISALRCCLQIHISNILFILMRQQTSQIFKL